jgi:hypothetical protein
MSGIWMASQPAGQGDPIFLIEKAEERFSVKYKLLALILGGKWEEEEWTNVRHSAGNLWAASHCN